MGGPSWTEYKGEDEQGEDHGHRSLDFRVQGLGI